MKKQLLLLFLIIIGFYGCSSNSKTDTLNEELLQEQVLQKLLSASNIEDTTEYNFAISSDIIDGIDTYKLNDKLSITSNDSQNYFLYYSLGKDYIIDEMTPIEFTTYYTQEAQEGFYTLKSEENMDVVVSTV